jgi:FkbH-like protein
MNHISAEPVRLVVWDLDETFWRGTLSEGGIDYRREHHDIVIELARRGIMSSICSKNDFETVRAVLEREGIWDYFIFPSINWDPKGPRLARLVEAVQLRAPTVMLIDDNPMNLGEAQHYVPGIQVADDGFVAGLLENRLFTGKPDAEMGRLKQYKTLEKRQADQVAAGGDNTAFLRESGLVVTIEHDFEKHLDRAIELINRTNQLNFTKSRLSENIDEARKELREFLSGYAIQAGILRVRDRYGDYGYSGLYVVNTGPLGQTLKHFCFSCRILNMGVESWLYQRLGRPKLRVKGEVLTDVLGDTRDIDWITVEAPGTENATDAKSRVLDTVYARGGCDLHAITHYFNMVAREVHGDFNIVESGVMMPLQHSAFARLALKGMPAAARHVFGLIGYQPEHLESAITKLPDTGRAVWILSFWSEISYGLYKHNFTGLTIPIPARHYHFNLRDMTALDPAKTARLDQRLLARVKRHFSFVGAIGEDDFKENVKLILSRATPETSIYILLANEQKMSKEGIVPDRRRQTINRWTEEAIGDMPRVSYLRMTDFASVDEHTVNPNHFDRLVYFKIYEEIMRRVKEESLALA